MATARPDWLFPCFLSFQSMQGRQVLLSILLQSTIVCFFPLAIVFSSLASFAFSDVCIQAFTSCSHISPLTVADRFFWGFFPLGYHCDSNARLCKATECNIKMFLKIKGGKVTLLWGWGGSKRKKPQPVWEETKMCPLRDIRVKRNTNF